MTTGLESLPFRLVIIGLTMSIQVMVMAEVYRRYRWERVNAYLLHPALLINVSLIATFFIPLVFYLLNPGVFFFWINFNRISLQLIFFCLAVSILNIIFYLVTAYARITEEQRALFVRIPQMLRRWLPFLFISYGLTWATRFLLATCGTSRILFADSAVLLQNKMRYPLLYPVYNFFNCEIYFPVLFALWLLYFTVLSSKKWYKTTVIVLTLVEIIYNIFSGSKMLMLQPLLAYFLAGLLLKKKVVVQLIALIVAFSVFLPFYNMYRNLGGSTRNIYAEFKRNQLLTYGEPRHFLFVVADSLCKRGSAFGSYFYFGQRFLGRTLNGATYTALIAKLVPDFLVPLPDAFKDKDINAYLFECGAIQQGDMIISEGPNFWSEAYLNFGRMGLFIGLSAFGLLSCLLFLFFLSASGILLFFVYAYFVMALLFLPYAGLALTVVPMVRITVCVLLVYLALGLYRKCAGGGALKK